MVKDAESHAAEDKRKREEVETRNRADQMAFETERNLVELGDKLDEGTRAKLQAGVERVRAALKGADMEEVKRATEELTGLWNQAAQQLYQTAGQPGQPGGADDGGPQGGTSAEQQGPVVDADYEVVDEDEKKK